MVLYKNIHICALAVTVVVERMIATIECRQIRKNQRIIEISKKKYTINPKC